MAKRTLQLLVALILSKLAMAVALAVAASSAVGAGSGGEVTALPPPEVFAEDPGGSVTQAVGILLAAVAAFGVAAFSPLLVSRLLPLAEAAVVAQGIRGMPVRGGTQAASMAYYSQGLTGMRLQRLAQGGGSRATSTSPPRPLGPPPPGTAPPPGPGSPGGGRPPSSPGAGRGGGGAPPPRWRPVPNQADPAPSPVGVGAVARTVGAPGAAAAGAGTEPAGAAAGGVAAGATGPAGAAVAGAAAGRVAASSLRAAVVAAQRAQPDVGAGGSAGGGRGG